MREGTVEALIGLGLVFGFVGICLGPFILLGSYRRFASRVSEDCRQLQAHLPRPLHHQGATPVNTSVTSDELETLTTQEAAKRLEIMPFLDTPNVRAILLDLYRRMESIQSDVDGIELELCAGEEGLLS